MHTLICIFQNAFRDNYRLSRFLKFGFFYFVFLGGLFNLFLVAVAVNAETPDSLNQKSIIRKDNERTPLQKLRGDTLNVDTTFGQTSVMPGEIINRFTPEQDSNYFRALKLRMPVSQRLNFAMQELEPYVKFQKELSEGTPLDIARRNLAVPPEYSRPSPQDVALYQYNIMQSFNVPFVPTYNPYGLKIPMNAIGRFLGLTEDVSPVLQYNLDYPAHVRVLIYSTQALVIATIIDENQPPGFYKYTWNGRDDRGRLMPSGDYVGEIRIGHEKSIVKIIHIP